MPPTFWMGPRRFCFAGNLLRNCVASCYVVSPDEPRLGAYYPHHFLPGTRPRMSSGRNALTGARRTSRPVTQGHFRNARDSPTQWAQAAIKYW